MHDSTSVRSPTSVLMHGSKDEAVIHLYGVRSRIRLEHRNSVEEAQPKLPNTTRGMNMSRPRCCNVSYHLIASGSRPC